MDASLVSGTGDTSPTEKPTNQPKSGSQSNEGSNNDRNVRFAGVVVYSFAREQGHCSIPDTGWCSLGMAQRHFRVSRYDIQHHQLLLRLRRKSRSLIAQRRAATGITRNTLGGLLPARMRSKFRPTDRAPPPPAPNNSVVALTMGDSYRVPNCPNSPPALSPQVHLERPCLSTGNNNNNNIGSPLREKCQFTTTSCMTPPPPCLSPPSPRRVLANLDETFYNTTGSMMMMDNLDTDSEASLDQMPAVNRSKGVRVVRKRGKLVPIHGPMRIRMLKESGVSQLDETERDVCLSVRATRSRVGCDCGPRRPCLPGRCSCIDEGVQCQVDRASFPCSCTTHNCHNPNGRTEFAPEEVRDHVRSVIHEFHSKTAPPEADRLKLLAPPIGLVKCCIAATTTIQSPIPNPAPPTPLGKRLALNVDEEKATTVKPMCIVPILATPPPPLVHETETRKEVEPFCPQFTPRWIASTPSVVDGPIAQQKLLAQSELPVATVAPGTTKGITDNRGGNNKRGANYRVGASNAPSTTVFCWKLHEVNFPTTPSPVRDDQCPVINHYTSELPQKQQQQEEEEDEETMPCSSSQHPRPSIIPNESFNHTCDLSATLPARYDPDRQAPCTPQPMNLTIDSVPFIRGAKSNYDKCKAPPPPPITPMHQRYKPSPAIRKLNCRLATSAVTTSETNGHPDAVTMAKSPVQKQLLPIGWRPRLSSQMQKHSRSASNSPITPNTLSRLSLRRRAIPRVPITPGRRVARSPRTPTVFSLSRKLKAAAAAAGDRLIASPSLPPPPMAQE